MLLAIFIYIVFYFIDEAETVLNNVKKLKSSDKNIKEFVFGFYLR